MLHLQKFLCPSAAENSQYASNAPGASEGILITCMKSSIWIGWCMSSLLKPLQQTRPRVSSDLITVQVTCRSIRRLSIMPNASQQCPRQKELQMRECAKHASDKQRVKACIVLSLPCSALLISPVSMPCCMGTAIHAIECNVRVLHAP